MFDIYYEVHGAGEPVIFIPGGFCDHHSFDAIKEDISRHYQMIVLDNRGSGLSHDTAEEYHLPLLAADVLRLMHHLQIDKAHFVGHSMGGFIAQYFAAYYPEKVLTLSLLSSILKMNEQGEIFLDQLLEEAKQNPDELLQKIYAIGKVQQTLPQVIKQIHVCRYQDATQYINLIKAPTLIMSGVQEPIMSVAETHKLAAAIKNTREIAILECNHMLPTEAPNEVSEKLLQHLNSNSYS